MKKIPNLDTLRFLAASMVIFQHIEHYKAAAYTESLWHIPFFQIIGCLGVTVFFVLSSFLITTLLLQEKDATGTIALKNFYRKRILRIWPLYYLIIILGFFLFPHLPFLSIQAESSAGYNTHSFLLYFTGLSNMGRTLYGNIPYVSHTWTLATEQLFYLMWPFVVLWFDKNLLRVMALIIVLYHATSFFLLTKHAYAIPYSRFIFSFLSNFYIQCMAYGGILAVLWHRKSNALRFLFHPAVFYSAIAACGILSVRITNFTVLHYDLYSVLFGIIVLNLAANPGLSHVLENKVSNYLGKISYGIYMYHPVIIVIAIQAALHFGSTPLIYLLSFAGAIVAAHLSFNYFEGYFLRKKKQSSVLAQTSPR